MAPIVKFFTKMLLISIALIPSNPVETSPIMDDSARIIRLFNNNPTQHQSQSHSRESSHPMVNDDISKSSVLNVRQEKIIGAKENIDDLETAAGTNVLRPLFVYRQQLAYRERIRKGGRRAAPNF